MERRRKFGASQSKGNGSSWSLDRRGERKLKLFQRKELTEKLEAENKVLNFLASDMAGGTILMAVIVLDLSAKYTKHSDYSCHVIRDNKVTVA